jgi:hypothetical protein
LRMLRRAVAPAQGRPIASRRLETTLRPFGPVLVREARCVVCRIRRRSRRPATSVRTFNPAAAPHPERPEALHLHRRSTTTTDDVAAPQMSEPDIQCHCKTFMAVLARMLLGSLRENPYAFNGQS